jgi:hypothetical protein
VQWTPDYSQAQQMPYPVVVKVYDSVLTTFDTAYVTVINRNRPPFFTVTMPDTVIVEDSLYQFTYTAGDSDGDNLQFGLLGSPTGVSINAQSGVFTWTPTSAQRGIHQFFVTVSDGSANVRDTVKITVLKINHYPVFVQTMNDTTISEDQLLSYAYSFTDSDNDTLQFTLQSKIDSAKVFNNGLFSWKPTFEQSGVHTVVVALSDGRVSILDTAFVTVLHVNRPPVFTSTFHDTTIYIDSTAKGIVKFMDPDSDKTTITLVQAPSNKFFIGDSLILWTALPEHPKVDTFIFKISDGQLNVFDTTFVTAKSLILIQSLHRQVSANLNRCQSVLPITVMIRCSWNINSLSVIPMKSFQKQNMLLFL